MPKVKAFVFHAKIARWTQRHQVLWIANVCELYHLNNCGRHLVGELVNNSMDSYESLNHVSVTKSFSLRSFVMEINSPLGRLVGVCVSQLLSLKQTIISGNDQCSWWRQDKQSRQIIAAPPPVLSKEKQKERELPMKAESCFHRKSCKWTNPRGATYKAVGFGRYLCAIFIQRQVRTGCQMREKSRVLRRHQTWPIGKSGFWFRNPDFGFATKRKIKTRIWKLRNMSLDFLSFGSV